MRRAHCIGAAAALLAVPVLATLALARETATLGEMCGGIAGVACGEGLYCEYPEGQCGVADLSGTCERAPEICTLEYEPVCGCDGNAYGNDCRRRSAGAQKDYDGECEKRD